MKLVPTWLSVAALLAGCAAPPPAEPESSGEAGVLLEANKLPAGETARPKCRTGETLVCRNVERLSDGRMPVDEDDLGSCRCRPVQDIGRIW